MADQTTDEWVAALTADDCVTIIGECISVHDFEGAVTALRILTVKDAELAAEVLATIQLGIAIRQRAT